MTGCRLIKLLRHPLFFPLAVAVGYFGLNLLLVLNHEPWRDEANPWQIAKALRLDNLFEVLRVEPHPPLWFLILAPFAKLGLPYITTNLISLTIMTLAVFLLARHGPFSKKAVILIAMSAAFFYFNPVISRNYCLVAMGVVVVAMAYKSRLEHPLRYAGALMLLCQSHFLAMGLAGVLTVAFGVEYLRKFGWARIGRLAIGLLLVGASVGVSLPIVIGNLGAHSLIVDLEPLAADWLLDLNLSLFGTVLPIFELSFGAVMLFLGLCFPRQLLFLLTSIGLWVFTLLNIYKVSATQPQRSTLLILFLIFAFWTMHDEKPRKLSKMPRWAGKIETLKLLRRIPVAVLFLLPVVATIPHTIIVDI